MKTIAFILIGLLSVSCLTVKRIERNCDQFEKICTTGNVDTVYIENTIVVTERDTNINFYFPRDTVYIETPVSVPPKVDRGLVNSKLSYLEAGLAWSTAQVKSGVLEHYLESGDTIIQIRLDNALRTEKQLRTELRISQKIIPVKENTQFAKFCIKVFWGVIIIVILGIVYLIFRFRSRLLNFAKKFIG